MPHFELSPKQHKALYSDADLVICGGGNGGGKSHTLRVKPIKDYLVPGARSVLFAESNPKLEQADGLVDECRKFYGSIHPGGVRAGYRQNPKKRWTFPLPVMPATIDLSYVGEPGQWDGLQAAFIGIDQGEQLREEQIWGVVGRNRTTIDVHPQSMLTVNPPAEGKEHYLTRMLTAGGWIDKDGWAIEAMDGVKRYFVRAGDDFVFGDHPEDLNSFRRLGSDGLLVPPQSMTFVQMLVSDHPIESFRREYEQKLAGLPEVERLRRWDGSWHATEEAGKYFRKEFFWPPVDYEPSYAAELVRSWDNAWSTSEAADWTPGPLVAREPDGFKYPIDMLRFRGTFHHVEWAVKAVAELDRRMFGNRVVIRLPKDAGAAGGLQSDLARWLGDRGYIVKLTADKGDKLTRSKPYQGCCERREYRLARSHTTAGIAEQLTRPFDAYQSDGTRIQVKGLDVSNVSTLAGWHDSFLADHVRFGRATIAKRSVKKDVVDAMVGAHEVFTDQQGRDPADVEPEDIEAAMQQAQREVGGSSQRGAPGLGGGRVGGPRFLKW